MRGTQGRCALAAGGGPAGRLGGTAHMRRANDVVWDEKVWHPRSLRWAHASEHRMTGLRLSPMTWLDNDAWRG